MSFVLYFIGFLIVIAGVAWGLVTAGVATVYVMIACVILLGIGILSAVTHTRSKDRPKGPSA
jgi:amino acid transporter